jgi:acetoin utilization deacetylase AcuC-like enzyme
MRVFWDEAQRGHDPKFFLVRGNVRPNFEVPPRAESLLAACRAMGLRTEAPGPLDMAAVGRAHDAGFVSFLRDGWAAWDRLPDRGPELVANSHPAPEALVHAEPPAHIVGQAGWYMADCACPIGPGSWAAIAAAASCAIAAADAVRGGGAAYALARPPGHHAYRARAGGHCYLNNAAIAAQRLRDAGAARVAVLDIDSHHGNGTQGIFWDRPDVLFVSVHGDPGGYYPWFAGFAHETGGAGAPGANINLPLALGTGDAGWLDAIGRGLTAIAAFRADALVVSLGFDASKDEPLNALSVTEDGFARAGAAIGAARQPTAIVQEGGYNVGLLGTLLTRFLGGFGG